jgi:hypothetical protein
MKTLSISLVVLSLAMAGCRQKTPEDNAKEYVPSNVRIHVEPTEGPAEGVLVPTFKLTVTNTGSKTIRKMKIVGDVSFGAYNDVSVKLIEEAIEKDGGKHEIECLFKKSEKMTEDQVLKMDYKFTVSEIEF